MNDIVNDGGLAGCGVLITRPEHQSKELAAEVEAAGGNVFHFPAIDITGRDILDIGREFAALDPPDFVIFVSSNAVAYGLPVVKGIETKIAAVGPATCAAIEALHVAVDISPTDGFDSEHLLSHASLQAVEGKNVIIMRGQSGRELLGDTLRERGAKVDYLCVYNRIPHEPTLADLEDLETALNQQHIQFVTVLSAETVEYLVQILPPQSLSLLRKSTLVAPSARVLQTASELIPGIATELVQGPQATAVVNTLIELRQTG